MAFAPKALSSGTARTQRDILPLLLAAVRCFSTARLHRGPSMSLFLDIVIAQDERHGRAHHAPGPRLRLIRSSFRMPVSAAGLRSDRMAQPPVEMPDKQAGQAWEPVKGPGQAPAFCLAQREREKAKKQK